MYVTVLYVCPQAVESGLWLLMEDIDLATPDVVSLTVTVIIIRGCKISQFRFRLI